MYCIALSFKDVYDAKDMRSTGGGDVAYAMDAPPKDSTDPYLDRAGLQCRTVKDTALVLDALRDPQRGYFDPRDVYTALPRSIASKIPYASFAAGTAKNGSKPLAGIRIGIGRLPQIDTAASGRSDEC